MDFDNINENKQTEFNSNAASLKRIDNDINIYKSIKNSEDWTSVYKKLEDIYSEARYKMTGKYKETRNTCDKEWEELTQLSTVYSLSPNDFNLKVRFSQRLKKFFSTLMDFMGERGMLLADKEDERGL